MAFVYRRPDMSRGYHRSVDVALVRNNTGHVQLLYGKNYVGDPDLRTCVVWV